MIEYFLQPLRVKALLIGVGAALIVAVGLLSGCVYLSGKLDTERAEHNTTRLERESAVKAGLGWKAVAGAANLQRDGLQAAVNECLNREQEARADAAERAAIMKLAAPRARTEAERKGVVDDATRKKAMDRLNRPL